jgi:hypothetical protein
MTISQARIFRDGENKNHKCSFEDEYLYVIPRIWYDVVLDKVIAQNC